MPRPGKWDVYLTVVDWFDPVKALQISQQPLLLTHIPEEAATTIGGHILSAHTSTESNACVAIMLLDHVFDVI